LGKAVAYSAINGHPGIQRLHPLFTGFILHQRSPDLRDCHESVQDMSVDRAIKKVFMKLENGELTSYTQ
jgi:hypothetical protein